MINTQTPTRGLGLTFGEVVPVFRNLIRAIEKRPGIPFTQGFIFGLGVSIYLGRKLVKKGTS